MVNFYAETISYLQNQFNTDLESGLSHAEVEKLIDQHGENVSNTKSNPWKKASYLEQVFNWRLLILVIAAVLFGITGDWQSTFLVGTIAVLSLMWTTFVAIRFQIRQKQLQEKFSYKVSVIRQGKQEKCEPSDIVPGDLLVLRQGNYIPADARIIKSDGLSVDESALFGSSGAAKKTVKEITETGLPPEKQVNMVFGGTFVEAGVGNAIVVRTGDEMEMHKINAEDRLMPKEITATENQLKFSKDIFIFAGLVVGTIAGLILWWQQSSQNPTTNLIKYVQIGLLYAIAATPYDITLLLNTIIDYRSFGLIKRGLLLRNSQNFEKLNRLTAFCSDENGIASTQSLKISNIFVDEQIVNRSTWEKWLTTLEDHPPDEKSKRVSNIPPGFHIPQGAPGLVLTAGLGTSGERYYDRNNAEQSHQQVIHDAVEKLGYQLDDIKANMQLVSEYPWTPNFGYELHVFKSGENEYLNIIVGDARDVLDASDSILVNGAITEFSYEQFEICNEILKYLDNSRENVYGVASIHSEIPLSPPEVQGVSTFLGYISFSVTDKNETISVIKSFLDTGIKVILICEGDEQNTTDLARELGLAHTRNAVATREELIHLSTQEFDQEAPNLSAYSQPTQEQRRNIVRSLKRHNYSVGFLGQNSIDQRAMVAADLAFADTRYATHYAQDHADCLIVDKGFKSVMECMIYARQVYQNLAGSLRWSLSCTMTQFLVVIFGLILHTGFDYEMPLSLKQVIWVQFLTTLLPAIGLGYEKILVDTNQFNTSRTTSILPKTGVFDIVCRSVVISLMTIIHFLVITYTSDEFVLIDAQSAACTTLFFAQVVSYFQCVRYPWESLFKRMFVNIRLLLVFLVVIGLYMSGMYIEIMQTTIGIVPLQKDWIITGLCSIILLLLPLNLAIDPRKDAT